MYNSLGNYKAYRYSVVDIKVVPFFFTTFSQTFLLPMNI
jgi:hypothetical protein